MSYLSPEEIEAYPPTREPPPPERRKEPLMNRLREIGFWTKAQQGGRRWPIACVSLEITQRCNLDCTLCYLSDHSEAVHDVPLEEIFRRIEMIHAHYGPYTDIQVSGGDPTLRKRDELVAIVRKISSLGMRASLFTNGIKATRDMLEELVEAGLVDVAFHVDLTQERKGYRTEAELNVIRDEYIKRAEGLPLAVYFNTSVFEGNFHEIPDLVRFFRERAGKVKIASFQLQADTGRGVLRERNELITQESVWRQIEAGAGTSIPFDVPLVGHPHCNKYSLLLACNGNLYSLFDGSGFLVEAIDVIGDVQFDRQNSARAVRAALIAFAKAPRLWGPGVAWLAKLFWRMRKDLLQARGRVDKISFFTHNFMDAGRLVPERVHGCVFMAVTGEGPISMCVYNAKRDHFLLKPVAVDRDGTNHVWDPLTGTVSATTPQPVEIPVYLDPKTIPVKKLKGRVRHAVIRDRKKAADRP